jgi:hypothetical protein
VAEIVAAQVARLTKILTLTTAQATEATSYFTTSVTVDQTVATNLATAQAALTTAVESDGATAIITTAANTIGTLTSQQVLADATAQASFYAILNSAQQTIYKELLAAGLQGVGGWGPAGPAPGAGGPAGGHH